MSETIELDERMLDLEVKLAFQDRLIRELDVLVRTFGDRLEVVTRELEQLKKAVDPATLGNEKPPHY